MPELIQFQTESFGFAFPEHFNIAETIFSICISNAKLVVLSADEVCAK